MSAAERWNRVEKICQAALDREPADRGSFIGAACAGDETVRREVESLLAQRASADGVLDRPAIAVAARLVSDVGASGLTGRRIDARIRSRRGWARAAWARNDSLQSPVISHQPG